MTRTSDIRFLFSYLALAVAVSISLLGFISFAHAETASSTKSSDTGTSSMSAQATSSAIQGEVSEQEFTALLQNAKTIATSDLKKGVLFGAVVAIGPDKAGKTQIILDTADGKTSKIAAALDAVVLLPSGQEQTLADVTPGNVVIIASAGSVVSAGTVASSDANGVTVQTADGNSITVGTTTPALFRNEAPASPIDYGVGDNVLLLSTSATSATPTVLALVAPKPVAPPVEEVATPTATTTTPASNNTTFLMIIGGIALLIIVLGYFALRSGRNDY